MEHEFNIDDALHFLGNNKVRKYFKKKELKEYYKWFMANIDNNIAQLKQRINAMKGGEDWKPDFSLESIEKLNEILHENIKGQFYNERAVNSRGSSHSRFLIDDGLYVGPSHDELILIYLIGVYLGETIVHLYPMAELSWDLCGQPWKYSDYGQMTLYVSDFNDINPTDMAMGTVYNIISHKYKYKYGPTNPANLYEWFLRRTKLLRENDSPLCMPQALAKLSPKKHLYDPRAYGHYKYIKDIYADMRAYNYCELGPRKKSDDNLQ